MRKRHGKKNNSYGNSLKWKVLLLILGILLMVGLVVFQYRKREKTDEKRAIAQEEVQEKIQNQKEETKEKSDGAGENGVREDVPKFGTQEEEQSEKQEIEITNLDEYATRIMGENTSLLNKRLTEWAEEYQLDVSTGNIIHVMVPKSDPQSINFYIRLSDERGSLVLLAYHPRENVVTASRCDYTEEEIINEVWENNAPAVRDVSPEEDTGGNAEGENAEAGTAAVENMEQEGVQTDDVTGQN